MALNGYSKKAEYFIELVGLAKDSIGDVIVDEKYGLIQLWSDDVASIVPPNGFSHPSFDEVVFYTNYFAYSHEIPAFLYPTKRKALTKPIEKNKASFINQTNYEDLRNAYEIINSLRLGPLAYVYFRWSGFQEIIHLPITRKYSNVSKEISLYSTALRQLDPLSESLNYYRIIESVSGNNGKNWILANLDCLQNYDFGFLEFEIIGEERVFQYQHRKNLFSFYRRKHFHD
jgi:hypothetical protein